MPPSLLGSSPAKVYRIRCILLLEESLHLIDRELRLEDISRVSGGGQYDVVGSEF